MIYFDHAASSWPKPEQVIFTLTQFFRENGANPGRGNHKMAAIASEAIYATRVKIAKLLNVQNPNQIVFFMNTTQALNQAIKGFLKKGDHVITSHLEHNSVRRPLEYLRKELGIEITYVKPNEQSKLQLKEIENAIQSNTRLFVFSHASNVLGTIQPIKEIGAIAKKNGIAFLVDAAQTVGRYQIDVKEMNIDLLAFPGHKALLGPQGVGGLYINPSIELSPLIHGGTGNQSEKIDQPKASPNRYESGTLNTVGIVGLGAGIDYIEQQGIEKLKNREWQLTQYLLKGLEQIPQVKWYGPDLHIERVPVVSLQIEGLDSNEVATVLDSHYQIAVRSGFHCAPLAHEICHTESSGLVRVSLGHTNTEKEIDTLLNALKEIISLMM
ncbi:aminotransferase class V-fold PLP-dependent enzyme [Tepidibacillus sp. HK-1]|uniref:aminotransferase class V-fold PLP-dependent enzyme n=1 Tax=Tepidibacillus sp. HK-1 TaxID=1883407 RepID=UPI0008536DA8|nr:aminotransferase class V-fold PLP-dependent enzyme [Tepidibacillus sp. HK-1]GBF11467.1 putative cysteine desulfurase [Tepidibacillus sp. HK-1]